MKRISFFLLLLFFSTTGLFAQSIYDIRNSIDFYNSYRHITNDGPSKALLENDIEGSPYLNNEFAEGTVYTNQKIQYNEIPLRYNIYNDELEFRTPDGQVLALTTPEIVEKADFGDYSMSYIPYLFGKKMKRGFFTILEEGAVSLYTRHETIFEQAKEAAAYKEPEPAKFVKRPDTYYLRNGQEAAVKIENKNDLIEQFPNHKEEIEAFIKKDKTKLGKPDKLIALVKYYNSL